MNLDNRTAAIPSPRIPIWLQLSLANMAMLAVFIVILSYVLVERQQANLYDHMVKLGAVSLNHVADNAKVPLLTDDTLALSTLINNVASVDGNFYALIVDTDGVIKAHTDHLQIGKHFEPFMPLGATEHKDMVSYFNSRMPDGTPVLNLSMPIQFQEKRLGDVHIGLSVDFIRKLFVDEQTFVVWATGITICLGMVAAVLYSLRFTRPLSALVHATAQIARGNYDFKVASSRNDELGRLGEAFNRMGAELSRQSMIRESFGKYVGTEVLDLITKSPEQSWLKGQRGEASILFADIRGFTAYAEGREPEEVVERLNEFFAIATKVIFHHGGYVDKFIGDSVLAVFGVPITHADHLQRCIKAAVDMQQELLEAARAGNPLLSAVGIGIASGVVVAGNIGSSAKMEYTVIGDSVNVASSLNGMAAPGEIIVGSDNGTDFSAIADVEPLPPQKIKNRERLVRVFRIVNMLCCLLILPGLFGCAGLDGAGSARQRGNAGDPADSSLPIPGAEQYRAITAEHQGRYHEALSYWQRAETTVGQKLAALAEQMQEIAESHAQRGVELFERKKGPDACREFVEALRFNPAHPVARDYLKNRYQAQETIEYLVGAADTPATIAEMVYGDASYAFAVELYAEPTGQQPLVAGSKLALADLASLFSQVLLDYNKDIHVARKLFADGSYQKVVPVVRTILDDHPADEEASFILNRSLLRVAEQQRQRGAFEEAIATLADVDPHFKNVKPLIQAMKEERKDKHEQDRTTANRTLFRQGRQLMAEHRYLEALQVLLRVDSAYDGVQPAISEVRAQLKIMAEEHFKEGVKLFVEENLAAAIVEWEKTLQFDPNHVRAALSLEKVRTLLKRVEEIK